MNSMTKSLLAAAALASLPLASQAIVFNTVSTSSGNETLVQQGGAAGHLFTTGASGITISDVGVFDADGDGLGNSATVEIRKAGSGGVSNPAPGSTVVGTYTVSAGPSTGSFTYAATGGLVLAANSLYYIQVTAMSGADLIGSNLDLPTFSNTGLSYNGDIIAGSIVGVGSRYKVANFIYTAVPEPETYAMVAGVGLVAFGLWRRRQ